eukprot:265862-Alexandrium_andersonii.AAC.1
MAKLRAEPRAIPCSAAVGALVKVGQRQAAFELPRSEAESQLEPDATVGGAAVRTCEGRPGAGRTRAA